MKKNPNKLRKYKSKNKITNPQNANSTNPQISALNIVQNILEVI